MLLRFLSLTVAIGIAVSQGAAANPDLNSAELAVKVQTQFGHSRDVRAVAFSPDGRLALSGSDDDKLKLWEVASGREIGTFFGHDLPVRSVAFSPDGKLALSGSDDETLKLWDVVSGREVRSFRAKSRALMPGGSIAISYDIAIRMRERAQHAGFRGSIYSVAFSPDGTLAASASRYDKLILWDVSSGAELKSFFGHDGPVYSAAFSPDGKTVLSGSGDRTLKLWSVVTGREIRSFAGHSGPVHSVTFSPDGKLALSGSEDSSIKLWDIESGRELKSFTGHKGAVQSVKFSPDGRMALSAASDKTVKLWDIASGGEIWSFDGHAGAVNAVAFSPDGIGYCTAGGAARGQAGQAQDTRRIAKTSRSKREYVLMISSPLCGFLKPENKWNSGAARGLDPPRPRQRNVWEFMRAEPPSPAARP